MPAAAPLPVHCRLLECVANVSEGRDAAVISRLGRSCGAVLADVHSDPHHHRSVFTMIGEATAVEAAARSLAEATLESVDLRLHSGAHPRTGALDVVPFVALEGWPLRDVRPAPAVAALEARDRFAAWAADHLHLPVYLYGPERALPDVRRGAWATLTPDLGPGWPHPSAGATAVGCRPLLVAYNLWLEQPDLLLARRVAAQLRSPEVRALGLEIGGHAQVSCNLVAPTVVGPAQVWDAVAAVAPIARAELVGMVPGAVLKGVPRVRWEQLGLSLDRALEQVLARRHAPGQGAPGAAPGAGGS